jgi:squalene-hopene/tetraprenyl-beta-curcumene cyclase
MKRSSLLILTTAVLCATPLATPLIGSEPLPLKPENVSFRNEIQLAIDRGLNFLKQQQKPEGYWSTAEHPALTAMPLMAFHREPTGKFRKGDSELQKKGFAFIRSKVKPDGGIYDTGLSNYNTSLAMSALLNTGVASDEPTITRARKFIIDQQAKGMAVESLDGGIGYGPTGVSPKRGAARLRGGAPQFRGSRQNRPQLESGRRFPDPHPESPLPQPKGQH